MTGQANPGEDTRMIVMGSATLTQGFGLVGFEAFPNATPEELEDMLGELRHSRQRALVLLETYLAHCDSPLLEQIRAEGGRILVAEVPALSAAKAYRPQVEELVAKVLGPGILEQEP